MKEPTILPMVDFARPICEAEEARGGRPAAARLAAMAAQLEADRKALAELETAEANGCCCWCGAKLDSDGFCNSADCGE